MGGTVLISHACLLERADLVGVVSAFARRHDAYFVLVVTCLFFYPELTRTKLRSIRAERSPPTLRNHLSTR